MKVRALDVFISLIFSIIILVLSIAVILVLTGFAADSFIIDLFNEYVFNEAYYDIVLITSIVLGLAALKTTVFHSVFKSKDKAPILVSTERGNVEIAQETITNTVKSVAMKIPNIKEVNARMVKKKNGIEIFANIFVLANSNIKDLTDELQSNVIEVVKETTGVKVLDVNVKVKNIYEKGQKNENKIAYETTNVKVEDSQVSSRATDDVEEKVVAEEIVENKEEKKEE